MHSSEADNRPWHKQFWPWFLISLLLAVMLACFYTIFLAVDNPLHMVKEDYYKEGLTINQHQQRYQRALELGVQARVVLLDDRLRVTFSSGMDGSARAEVPPGLHLQFIHPLNSTLDVSLKALRHASGDYQSDVLNAEQQDLLLTVPRWYIYLEPVTEAPAWILHLESPLHRNQALVFGGRDD